MFSSCCVVICFLLELPSLYFPGLFLHHYVISSQNAFWQPPEKRLELVDKGLKTNNIVTQHDKKQSLSCSCSAVAWNKYAGHTTSVQSQNCWPHRSENPMTGQNLWCSGPARETVSAAIKSTCQSTEGGAEAERNLTNDIVWTPKKKKKREIP